MLLSKCAPIIEDLMLLATGEEQEGDKEGRRINVDKDARKVVIDAIIPMMRSAGDAQKIEAGTTHDVITCLKEGKITFLEAKQLMDMLSIKSDMDDVKKLLEAVNQLNGGALPNG